MFSIFRVEIIRLSDKTFKETIKDGDLSPIRSSNKGGYLSLDPSNPLPHENENRKIKEFNNNTIRELGKNEEMKDNFSFNATFNGESDGDQKQYQLQKLNEYSMKLLSQNEQQSDENILFNKNQFREILMNVLNITNLDSELPDILDTFSNDGALEIDQEYSSDNEERKGDTHIVNVNESVKNADGTVSNKVEKTLNTKLTDDDNNVIKEMTYKENSIQTSYPNESIEKLKVPDNFHVSTISEETPEVDKILNGGKFLS